MHFHSCSELDMITIGECVKIIRNCAFYCYFSLKSITIPSSVIFMDVNAFQSCFELETVTIGECENNRELYILLLFIIGNYHSS